MRKFKELILEHKAISIGLALVLILVLVDGGIFAANFMKKQADQAVQQEQAKQEQTKQPDQPQQQQQPEQQQQQNQNSSSGGGTRTPSCNQTAANTFTNQYSAAVDAENARHNAAIAAIQNGPEIYPGYKQIAIAQENAQHNTNLTSLNAVYQANLRSVNC